MQATGYAGPYCVEVNTPEFRALPVDEAARRAADAATECCGCLQPLAVNPALPPGAVNCRDAPPRAHLSPTPGAPSRYPPARDASQC